VPIAYEGAATPYTATGSGTTFTLNKPAGATAGMRLYATVACWTASQRTISATGWTHLNTQFRAVSSDGLQVTVLTRYVESGDPASWSATASGTVALRVAGVVAYSGVQSTGNRNGNTAGNGVTTVSTGSVTNETADSWRLVCGAYYSGSANYDIESNEAQRRWIAEAVGGSDAVQAASWDSNAGVATGSHSRTVNRDAVWSIAAGIIVLLTPSAGTPASGDWAGTLKKPVAAADGEVHNDAVAEAELPGLSAALEGEGQPLEGEGGFTAGLGPVVAAVEGGVEPQGTLAGLLPLTVSMRGETRLFGVRVVNVDADDRVIKVQSRAVTG
jgi:hypothetical protein